METDYPKARRSAVTARLNIHPNWRALALTHIRMVRQMLRDGREITDCRRIIKNAQRDMVYCRKAIASALAIGE